jgi:hypothetical protein
MSARATRHFAEAVAVRPPVLTVRRAAVLRHLQLAKFDQIGHQSTNGAHRYPAHGCDRGLTGPRVVAVAVGGISDGQQDESGIAR